MGGGIRVSYDAETREHRIVTWAGKWLTSVMVFWFAWQAFYPETALYFERDDLNPEN